MLEFSCAWCLSGWWTRMKHLAYESLGLQADSHCATSLWLLSQHQPSNMSSCPQTSHLRQKLETSLPWVSSTFSNWMQQLLNSLINCVKAFSLLIWGKEKFYLFSLLMEWSHRTFVPKVPLKNSVFQYSISSIALIWARSLRLILGYFH